MHLSPAANVEWAHDQRRDSEAPFEELRRAFGEILAVSSSLLLALRDEAGYPMNFDRNGNFITIRASLILTKGFREHGLSPVRFYLYASSLESCWN